MKHLGIAFLLNFAAFWTISAQTSQKPVVLNNDASFEYIDETHATYSRTYTVSIPSKDADRFGVFVCNINTAPTKLKSFSGEIKEASGRSKKSETVSWIQEFLSVRATLVISYSDGILSFPPFVPQPFSEGISLESATYTLSVPSKDCFSYKAMDMEDPLPEHVSSTKGETLKWSVKDLPAGSQGAILFTPRRFSYQGRVGSGEDWVSLGNWIYSLSEGQNTLPAELEAKVKELTQGCSSDREMIEKLHDYMGESTRYVSIQLGLGGLKPLDPSFVYKNKFGDCKALSSFLQAMLASCGINSDYVIINLGNDRIQPDFPSLATANHAILCIPQQNDTLWVECTNNDIPLGYVHRQIAGNHALVIEKDRSFVTRLPIIKEEDNSDSIAADILLDPEGIGKVTVNQSLSNIFWETCHGLSKKSLQEQNNAIKEGIVLPMVQLSDLTIESHPEAKPFCKVNYTATASPYASKTGSRLFIPVNPFRSFTDNTSRSRQMDLDFKNGWVINDELTLHLPDGYRIESEPEDFAFENKFGSAEFKLTRQEGSNDIFLHFRITQHSGHFPKSDYQDYRTFMKNLEKICGKKIVLVR